jgi:ketosteroid isomerase-like protein
LAEDQKPKQGFEIASAFYSADICRLPLTANPKQVLISCMKTRCIFAGCFTLLSLAFVGLTSAADSKAIEQNLRDLDDQWSATAGSKDLEKTVSFYSEDAVVMPPNASAAVTKEAIRKVWQDLLASPGFVISWKTTKVEVAKSGDLACISGTYDLTMNDPSGKPINDHGKYVEVWEKQADGKWKCGTDIWNSDLTAATSDQK